ncbi:hypothetical protein [Marinimicrobium agarilyticum]|nr:hypothetical protein [Marinimicrobium agarilyticum]
MAENTDVMHQNAEHEDQGDGVADAIAAVALIAIFVVTCIYWVSGQ